MDSSTYWVPPGTPRLSNAVGAARARLAAAAVPAALVAAVLLAALVRLPQALGARFPLNDGGLFYLMTRELQAAHFALPAATAYNHAGLPFAYPPLAFYVAGALAAVGGWPLLDVVRVLPGVVSVLTVPVFALLAWALLRGPVERVAAVFAFALLPRLFGWFVMGGGLPRAPGLLFALLTVHQAYLFYTRREWRYAATTAVAGALAVATHLENAWFAAYSAGLVFAFYGRHRRGVVGSAVIALAVVALTAPWWGTVVAQHGWAPFAAARGASGYGTYPVTLIRTLRLTDEPYVQLLGVLGLLGAFWSVAAGRFFLPCWVLLILVVNPRNPTTPAMVPWALLVGVAAERVVAAGLRAARTRWAPAAVAAALGFVAAYGFMSARAYVRYGGVTATLPAAERGAMAWVGRSTPPDSRFVVLSLGPEWFGVDPTVEWFPALAERTSVSTPQAYEWLPGQFLRRGTADDSLRTCRGRDIGCVERWASRWQQPYTHVFLPKAGCCGGILASLRASPAYVPLYENDGVAIFARRRAAPTERRLP